MSEKLKKIVIDAAILAAGLILALGILRLAEAGSLTPNTAPASTMQSLQDIYDAIGGIFSSGSLTPDANGSAIEIARCAAARLTGSSCP